MAPASPGSTWRTSPRRAASRSRHGCASSSTSPSSTTTSTARRSWCSPRSPTRCAWWTSRSRTSASSCPGAGAAGTAILKLLLEAGVKHAVVADIHGVVHERPRGPGRRGAEGSPLRWIADNTNPEGVTGTLKEAVRRRGRLHRGLRPERAGRRRRGARWRRAPIVFALANPDPEVDPAVARETAAVVATGRSDFPNQINNVLVFPGVFRGLLDAQSRSVNHEMMLAAARALADVVARGRAEPELHHPERLQREGLRRRRRRRTRRRTRRGRDRHGPGDQAAAAGASD